MAYPFPTATVDITTPNPRALDNTLHESPLAPMNLSMNEVPGEGVVFHAPGAIMIATDALANAEPAFAAMRTGMQTAIIPALQANSAEYNPAIVGKKNEQVIKNKLAPLFRGAMDAGMNLAESVERNQAKFENIPAATDAPTEQAWREEFRSMTKAQKLRALQQWPINGIFAVARLSREPYDLTEDEWQFALNRVRANNLANADAVRTSFTRKPSLDDPIARGSDEAKISKYVEDALKTWAARRELVKDARTELRQVVQFVAVVCEMPIQSAWALLSGIEADDAK